MRYVESIARREPEWYNQGIFRQDRKRGVNMQFSQCSGKKNPRFRIVGIAAVLLLAVLGMLFASGMLPARTSLQIEGLSRTQIVSLERLCKVWGVSKYYHTELASGKRDWDAELLKLMPAVLSTNNLAETDALLAVWLEKLGSVTK